MTTPPPLAGIRVLEIAGLAPGPFAGLLLADYGATVLRIDRAVSNAHSNSSTPPSPTSDSLVRHKSSICVDFKSPAGLALVKALIPTVDVLIEPFRPGVLEKLGLGPAVLNQINPRIVLARMTGFRRDGKYKDMAGHDINYIAVSGVLSMLGRKGEKPYPPGNVLGDFAGGGAVCFMGILLALMSRDRTGRGQVVEANMVDGSAYMATMPRLAMKAKAGPTWAGERGTNMLDGGAPFYGTYETKDGKFMSVGALEPQFFAALLKGLSLKESDLPGSRDDPKNWPAIWDLFTKIFKSKTRADWESIFDGTDACALPVLTQAELEQQNFDHRPVVTLSDSPAFAIAPGPSDIARPAAEGQGAGVKGGGWDEPGLRPGAGGEEVLEKWMNWHKGKQYDVEKGGLFLIDTEIKSKI